MANPFAPDYTASLISKMLDATTPEPQMATQPVIAQRSHLPIHLALAAMDGGQAADAITTINALKHQDTEEANPVYGSHPSNLRVIGTKTAVALPLTILLDRLYNKHPKLAMSLALGAGAVGFGTALHNASVTKK